jgi:hypothetical protein
MKSFYNAATKPRIVLMALRVSLVVGSILNLINQGSQIAAWIDIDWINVS